MKTNLIKQKNVKSLFSALIFSAVLVFSFTSCETLSVIGDILAEDSDSTLSSIGESMNSISKASEEITPENEYYIGRSVAAAITSTYTVCRNAPVTTAYLNKICNAITINSEVPYLYKGYRVAIIDTDEINAMATPGGHIFVSRGLIKSVDSEDALAAVIAHEIGHIQLKHSISAIKSSRVTTAISKTAKASVLVAAENNDSEYKNKLAKLGISEEDIQQATSELFDAQEKLLSTLVNSGFSKEQEYAADSKALTLMADAGYDPNAMLDMLNLISGNSSSGGWNKTHPSAANRIKNVTKDLKKVTFAGEDKAVRQERFNKLTRDLK